MIWLSIVGAVLAAALGVALCEALCATLCFARWLLLFKCRVPWMCRWCCRDKEGCCCEEEG